MNMEESMTNEQTQVVPETIEIKGVKYYIARIPRSKKVYRVRQLKPNQMEDIAKLLVADNVELAEAVCRDKKLACKAAAIYLLPNFWWRKMTYWLRWRWFYYIRQYDDVQVQPILSAGNESTPYLDFLNCMTLLNYEKEAMMRMTKSEAEKFIKEAAELSKKLDEAENENSKKE